MMIFVPSSLYLVELGNWKLLISLACKSSWSGQTGADNIQICAIDWINLNVIIIFFLPKIQINESYWQHKFIGIRATHPFPTWSIDDFFMWFPCYLLLVYPKYAIGGVRAPLTISGNVHIGALVTLESFKITLNIFFKALNHSVIWLIYCMVGVCIIVYSYRNPLLRWTWA